MLLLKLLGILFLPVIVGAILPRRLSGLVLGSVILIASLVLLDERNIPIEDRDSLDAFIGHLLVEAWLVLAGAALLLRATLGGWRQDGAQAPAPLKLHQQILGWPLPIGALLAVCLMHWLSNRMAGAEPAWVVQLMVAGASAAILALVLHSKWLRTIPDVSTLAAVTAVTCTLLVGKAAIDARQWRALADVTAAGRPYCLLTFAGREHIREAKQVLELSPLVSRSGGRSFVEDRPYFIVIEGTGPRAKGWKEGRGGTVTDAPADLPLACVPRIGGGIA